ncbi:DNA-binding response regulator, AraC family [hydrothermal vent metagenome]|uniref:DNA-binding response regulator, AraC family n=1 Tax=hydrothermal vent metagenome TaxID=652676 RepID=A0A3B0UR38_9ZZZZ
MLIRILFLGLSLLTCLVSISKGQYNYLLSDYIIEVWSAEEGLPSNNLRHIAKDKDGFLWISTFNGLVRFDGNKFKTFDTNNVPFLSSSAFYSVLPLADGSMYIGTQASGLILYKNRKFISVLDSGNLPKSIQTSFLDNTGRLWIGTRNGGVYYLENNKIHRYSIPQLDNQSIQSITQDDLNNVWIASEGKGVAKIAEDTFKVYTVTDGLSSNIVNAILFYNGKIYAGTEKGLVVYQNKKWIVDNRFDQIKINYIIADKNRNLWFASSVGLGRISHLNKFEYLSEKDGLPSRQVSSITFDDENNIWLTTKRGGLAQLKISNFKNITPADGLSYKGINVIEEGPNGSFYVGSDNGDIDLIKDGIIKKLPMSKEFKSISVKDIFSDDDGTLWIATYDGVIKKHGLEEKYFGIDQGLVSLKTRRILKDFRGVIWVGSRNGGINKIYPDDRVESITVKDGLGSDFVLSVDEAPDGRIVVGTANGGLNIIYPNGKIEILKPTESIVGLSIFNVYIENNNRFWLATNIGLYCYQNNKFTLINTKNGLPVETIFDIKEDNSGNLWATSIWGFVRVSKNNVRDFVNGELDKIEATLLNDSDGMVSHECTGATRFLKTQEGVFWIPTIKGISILDPQKLIINLKVPAVFIEDIIVDDEVIELERAGENEKFGKVIIKPGHRNYVINYTSLSMYSPEKVKFIYKLEGFDEDWVEIGTDRHAKYTNLPYGNYSFKVMAANNNGVWSSEYATVEIEIKPFFYETQWFIVLIILAFVLATVSIYVFQTKAVKSRNNELIKLNNELDSFAYSVSHDLKAPLSSIQGLLNIAKLENGKNAMEFYQRIDSSVEKLDNFIKDIIDYSKNARMGIRKETINVKELLTSVLEGLAFLESEKKIKTIVEVDDDLLILTDKTRFTFIVNNLLTNAYRYADFTKAQPFVKTTAGLKGSNFYLKIEDNGQGIKEEFQAKIYEMFYRANENSSGSGLGLYIVKESLAKLKGNIVLKSVYQKGTIVHVEIPV